MVTFIWILLRWEGAKAHMQLARCSDAAASASPMTLQWQPCGSRDVPSGAMTAELGCRAACHTACLLLGLAVLVAQFCRAGERQAQASTERETSGDGRWAAALRMAL